VSPGPCPRRNGLVAAPQRRPHKVSDWRAPVAPRGHSLGGLPH
jgi:hypothetical protein